MKLFKMLSTKHSICIELVKTLGERAFFFVSMVIQTAVEEGVKELDALQVKHFSGTRMAYAEKLLPYCQRILTEIDNMATARPANPTVRENRTVETPVSSKMEQPPVSAKNATTEIINTPVYHCDNSLHPLRMKFKQLIEAYPFGKAKFNQVSDFEKYRKVIKESHTTHEQLIAGATAYAKYVSSQGTQSSYVLNGGSWLAKGEWSKEYVVDNKPLKPQKKTQTVKDANGNAVNAQDDHLERLLSAKYANFSGLTYLVAELKNKIYLINGILLVKLPNQEKLQGLSNFKPIPKHEESFCTVTSLDK
jgi:hypothetical protein